jgi:hypothetical protein
MSNINRKIKKMFMSKEEIARNDARAAKLGLPKLHVGMYDDEEIADAAAEKYMDPKLVVKQLRRPREGW